MPTIAVRDLAIQKRENDLVAATFGRGFYVLDDLTPLRSVTAQTFQQPGALFPARDALMYIEQRPIGGKHGSFGATYFEAEDPHSGAVITYSKEEYYTTKKVSRQQEKAAQSSSDNSDKTH